MSYNTLLSEIKSIYTDEELDALPPLHEVADIYVVSGYLSGGDFFSIEEEFTTYGAAAAALRRCERQRELYQAESLRIIKRKPALILDKYLVKDLRRDMRAARY